MFSSPSSLSSLFTSLPARPPTPPRDLTKDVDEAFRFLEEGHDDSDLATHTKSLGVKRRCTEDTPPQRSPVTSQARASTAEKRVDFSPFPTVHNLPQPGHSGSPVPRPSKRTPLRHQIKPLKSILKASANDHLPLTPDDLENKLSYFSPQEPGSFRKMLQSVLSQLASQSRDDRRDAYLAINGAMKNYDGVPDPDSLSEKMPYIQQFIARDLTWKDQTGRLDFSMVSQALTLTLALMHSPETESAFDDDFRNLLIERSISVIEQDDMNKAVYKLHMYLLGQQRFKSHILTTARADKLLTALQGSEDRCSGNSVVSSRLIVYSRLLKQAPAIMLPRMRDWIEHVFHGMLSCITDVRIRAIETCVQAGLILGDQAQAAKVMYEIAEREGEEGQSYGNYLNARLKEMSADKELAKWVPQIWAAVVLLFRCKRRPVDKWPCFKDWLGTMQRSLNSSDTEVKQHANIAWNKLVFAVMPGSTTSESMRSMLRIPIMAGLEKRGIDRVSQQHRQIAMDSYCNLLHYGLRPGLNPEEIDHAWHLYVEPILSKMAQSSSRSQQHSACCILQGLLKKGTGVWNKNAANEPGTIKPDDLPRLEPRWVRSRLTKLIKILEPILLSGMWIMPDANEAANTCWRLLLEAVAEAGSQEVKASNDFKEAMAQLTNLFRRVWNGDWKSRNEAEGHVWLDRFHVLIETAINCIGASHFVEDLLSKTGEDELEAAPTPSHRTAKHSVVAYPSFVFLFALYYQTPSPLRTSGLYKDSAAKFLQLLSNGKGSLTGSLALLHRALQFGISTAEHSDVAGQLWNLVAHEAAEALQADKSATSQRDSQVKGNALRSAVNILLHGLCYANSSPGCFDRAVELYDAACSAGKLYANDGGVVLGVMEPFSKSVIEILDDLPINTVASITGQVLCKGVWPKSRQELDHSRKALWTVSLDLPRASVFDPFEHVYGFLNGLLARSYENLSTMDKRSGQALSDMLRSLLDFLRRCPLSILPAALRKIQTGLVHWIEDRHRVLFPLKIDLSRDPNVFETIATCVVEMWSDVTMLLVSLNRKDSALLEALEPLLVAGFSSPSRDVVNSTISFWNIFFGVLSSLEYPVRIQGVLRARQSDADLELPGFPSSNDDTEVAELPAFAELRQDSPEKLKFTNWASSNLSRPAPEMRTDTVANQRPLLLESTLTNGLGSDYRLRPGRSGKTSLSTIRNIAHHIPAPHNVKIRKDGPSAASTPRAKLRHDDSQIDFAPIDPTLPKPADVNASQLLTNHQKEVQARQRGDAQIYPDLSSSPIPCTDSRTIGVVKRLDFVASSEQDEDAALATPTGLADANPMSDDLPSSPTPRSNGTFRADGMRTQYSEDDEETVCDPPSSPPRTEDQLKPLLVHAEALDEGTELTSMNGYRPPEVETCTMGTSNLPSDTLLPTAQLEREAAEAEATAAAAAAEAAEMEFKKATAEKSANAVTVVELEPYVTTSHQTTTIRETQIPRLRSPSQNSPETPSRIENSVIEVEEGHGHTPASTGPGTAISTPQTRGQRKRKRNGDVSASKNPAKKRAKSSPFRLWDRLRGGEQDYEDDTDDEIVVASSQHRSSPEHAREEEVRPQPEQELQTEPTGTTESAEERPVKRKPGRPRKSGPRAPINVAAGAKSLKRTASVVSTMSTQSQTHSSVVDETPAVPRARKSARLSQAPEAPGSRRKVVIGVLPSPPPLNQALQYDDEDLEDENAGERHENVAPGPGQQLTSSECTGTPERRILQPKSILGRLRGVLADCKKMVFGAPEELREFDDMLFEIRQEIHEAGRKFRRKDEE